MTQTLDALARVRRPDLRRARAAHLARTARRAERAPRGRAPRGVASAAARAVPRAGSTAICPASSASRRRAPPPPRELRGRGGRTSRRSEPRSRPRCTASPRRGARSRTAATTPRASSCSGGVAAPAQRPRPDHASCSRSARRGRARCTACSSRSRAHGVNLTIDPVAADRRASRGSTCSSSTSRATAASRACARALESAARVAHSHARARLVPARDGDGARATGGAADEPRAIVKPLHRASSSRTSPGKPIEELERELGIRRRDQARLEREPARALAARGRGDARRARGRAPLSRRRELRAARGARGAARRRRRSSSCSAAAPTRSSSCVAKAFLGPGDEAVFAWPSFAMYPIVVKGMGATLGARAARRRRSCTTSPRCARRSPTRTRVVFVCNPNNPTGTSVGADGLRRASSALAARRTSCS